MANIFINTNKFPKENNVLFILGPYSSGKTTYAKSLGYRVISTDYSNYNYVDNVETCKDYANNWFNKLFFQKYPKYKDEFIEHEKCSEEYMKDYHKFIFEYCKNTKEPIVVEGSDLIDYNFSKNDSIIILNPELQEFTKFVENRVKNSLNKNVENKEYWIEKYNKYQAEIPKFIKRLK